MVLEEFVELKEYQEQRRNNEIELEVIVMFQYIKTIENLNNLPNRAGLNKVIGVIQKIDFHDWDGKNTSFKLSAEDTDITLNCICNNGLNESKIPRNFRKGDPVVISGWYDNGVIWCYCIRPAPIGLTGTMMHDVLILSEEINSLISVQGQNGYISDNAWGKLQESLFEFRDIVKEITYFGGGTFDEKY